MIVEVNKDGTIMLTPNDEEKAIIEVLYKKYGLNILKTHLEEFLTQRKFQVRADLRREIHKAIENPDTDIKALEDILKINISDSIPVVTVDVDIKVENEGRG